MAKGEDERHQIRVRPLHMPPLASKADDTGQDLSACTLESAEVLAERPVLLLSPQAAQAFSDALAQPTTVNERLAAALARPRGFRWAG